jgi:hypothetical protein
MNCSQVVWDAESYEWCRESILENNLWADLNEESVEIAVLMAFKNCPTQ